MIQALTRLILANIIALGIIGAVPQVASAFDDELFKACDGPNANTAVCRAEGKSDAQSIAQNIISLLFWIIGVASVIVIVVGGLKYVTSNGDSNRIQSAKNTIMYAVIGLVVAIMGQAIVLFVVSRLQG